MTWHRRCAWQIAVPLVLAVVWLATACGHVRTAASPVPSRSPVAYVARSNPRQALDRYLSAWTRRFYAHHSPGNPTAGSLAPGKWIAYWQVARAGGVRSLATASDQHMAYRVDFLFMVGIAPSLSLLGSVVATPPLSTYN